MNRARKVFQIEFSGQAPVAGLRTSAQVDEDLGLQLAAWIPD